ncbi:MAG TPA: hypothetical protein VFF30_19445 [Nitrososphaerales archaeon]|nr:hypothetical protein [Nitrososphaerales archaeon]
MNRLAEAAPKKGKRLYVEFNPFASLDVIGEESELSSGCDLSLASLTRQS